MLAQFNSVTYLSFMNPSVDKVVTLDQKLNHLSLQMEKCKSYTPYKDRELFAACNSDLYGQFNLNRNLWFQLNLIHLYSLNISNDHHPQKS